MYSIGEFAKLLGINYKTLRYYDLIGILKPSTVDKYTGYRSYSNNQIAEYKKIVYLKKIGFTLEEIKENLINLKLESVLRKKQELILTRENLNRQIEELTNLENTLDLTRGTKEKTLIKK